MDESTSSSDSDLDIDPPRSSRKRRIIWSSTSSDSSDSDIAPRRLLGVRKRTRLSASSNESLEACQEPLNVISDSESEQSLSFESSDETDGNSDKDDILSFRVSTLGRSSQVIVDSDSSSSSVVVDKKASSKGNVETAIANSESSDSGDESTEKCAICLRRIKDQEVGTPEGCDHTYCLTCLVQWSKASNKCPMDRIPFSIILVRANKGLEVVRRINVSEPIIPVADDESFIFCWVCGQSDRDEEMLLCDGCDRGFHLDCLNPPLAAVPQTEEWYCPNCSPYQQGDRDSDHFHLLNEDEEQEAAGRTRGRRNGGPASNRRRTGYSLRPVNSWPGEVERLFEELLHPDRFLHINHVDELVQPSSSATQSSVSQPSTSGTQRAASSRRPVPSATRGRAKKATTRSKKTVKKKRRRRRTVRRRYTVCKKKVEIVNDDGTVTEEIVEVCKAVRRRRKKRKVTKKKTRANGRATRGTNILAPPRTVRGRLARTLGMVTRTTPGQLVAQVSRPRTAALNGPRVRAGIPTLHIFGPRDELAPVSSGSEGDDEGGVATMARRRTTISSRARDRCKAIELLSAPRQPIRIQSTPASSEPVDLLGSILESQAIWHSKNTDVTIHNDGTVVVRPNDRINVRGAGPERVATHAPIYPGAEAQAPGSYSTNRSPESSRATTQTNNASPSASSTIGGRYGSARNDREGYTNFLNNMSGRPTPFCRGGPPLRFRMPARPQLRRIPLIPRPSRPLWQQDDDVEPTEEERDESSQEKAPENESKSADEDVDLYSDIEPNNTEKECEGSGDENVPQLGPPPEPPAFLLGFGEDDAKNNDSEVYDPAEPCDSDEEMVIDVGTSGSEQQRLPTPPLRPTTPTTSSCLPVSDSADEECPILSLYSSESVEHSRLGEEERARDLEAVKYHSEEQNNSVVHSQPPSPKSPEKHKEIVGARLSFNIEPNQDESQDSSHDSEQSKSPEYEEAEEKLEKNDDTWAKVASPPTSKGGSKSPQPSLHPSSPSATSDLQNLSGELSRDHLEKPDDDDISGPRVTTGLEGLDVEEVSSENDFNDKCSISSLSALSNRSRSHSPIGRRNRKKKKRQKVKAKRATEEGEIDSDPEKQKTTSSNIENKLGDENKNDNDKKKKRKSSRSPDRRVLGSKENKKPGKGTRDLSWKKPSKKDKNFREGKKTSNERDKSRERRSSRSASPKKDKKKQKDKKKSDKEKKKEIERYDVRKVVKNKEVNERKTDEFGRDLPSKSLSLSRSRSRSRSRVRPRRRISRSISKSPTRGFRRGRSPARRRIRSRSRSNSSPRRNKKKIKSSDRKGGSKTRPKRSRSRSPRRTVRRKKSRDRSPSFSPSPVRVRRSLSPIRPRRSLSPLRARRNFSRSWSRLASPPRDPSLEKLTVVLTAKEKKKRKRKREEKRPKRVEKKKSGNSKEVFASGDNVLVSVNFNRSLTGNAPRISVSPVRDVSVKKKKRTVEDVGRLNKKTKNITSVTKTIVDAALTQTKKTKKLTRLNEKEAEIILNRKPVAVIDLDMSPYREQTPSPVNVVVVSDSGSGEEGKAPSPNSNRISPAAEVINPLSVVASGPYITSTGPKTPPEPPVKFSLIKPQQIMRSIANPLADGDDDDDGEEDEDNQPSRKESEGETMHKGPNTPPEPRPTTPKTSPSPQSSPDAYDPFEPTKSRSPSPAQEPVGDKLDNTEAIVVVEGEIPTTMAVPEDDVHPEPFDLAEKMEVSEPDVVELAPTEPIDSVLSLAVKPVALLLKKPAPQPIIATVPSLAVFALASPSKTQNRQSNVPMTGIQRLQHRLGSPVNKTPNSIKTTPEKRGPELLSTGNFKIRNAAAKRNGDAKPRPLQDATNETVVDMDDSPYSPASSEGDDLFDPPAEPIKPVKSAVPYKSTKAATIKAASKFDLLFGSTGPNISPIKNGKKKNKGATGKQITKKGSNKGLKKGISLKMDEDQLRILDELPSSAVELQVKDKFLKKLNRQERVVDEVKTVLKPHYARKHITKEEYKDILRRAVPKICHSKSGEINPSKIQHLVEAYVRKYRHAKKKTTGATQKPKMKKTTMFS